MVVRDATEGDAEALSRLMTDFTHVHTTPTQVRQRLTRSLGIEHPVLAELNGQAVGFASLRLINQLGEDGPHAELSELFVSEGSRRRGVARALMAELVAKAHAAGASNVAVLTAADNEAALALYRSIGFEKFSVALQKWLTDDRPYRNSNGAA